MRFSFKPSPLLSWRKWLVSYLTLLSFAISYLHKSLTPLFTKISPSAPRLFSAGATSAPLANPLTSENIISASCGLPRRACCLPPYSSASADQPPAANPPIVLRKLHLGVGAGLRLAKRRTKGIEEVSLIVRASEGLRRSIEFRRRTVRERSVQFHWTDEQWETSWSGGRLAGGKRGLYWSSRKNFYQYYTKQIDWQSSPTHVSKTPFSENNIPARKHVFPLHFFVFFKFNNHLSTLFLSSSQARSAAHSEFYFVLFFFTHKHFSIPPLPVYPRGATFSPSTFPSQSIWFGSTHTKNYQTPGENEKWFCFAARRQRRGGFWFKKKGRKG